MAAAAILNFGKMSITPEWINISAPNFTGIVEASNFKFGTQLGFGTSLPKKQRFGPKLAGVWARGAAKKKFGTPYIFLQPLKPAASNLVHKMGLALAYQKTTFWTKIGGGLGQGSIQKKFGTPKYFCNR